MPASVGGGQIRNTPSNISPFTNIGGLNSGSAGAVGGVYPNEKGSRNRSLPTDPSDTSTGLLLSSSVEQSSFVSQINRHGDTSGSSHYPSNSDSGNVTTPPAAVVGAQIRQALSQDGPPNVNSDVQRSMSTRTLVEQMVPTLSPGDITRLADTIVARMQIPSNPHIIPLPIDSSDVGTESEYQEPPPPWRASWVEIPNRVAGSTVHDDSSSSGQRIGSGVTSNESESTRGRVYANNLARRDTASSQPTSPSMKRTALLGNGSPSNTDASSIGIIDEEEQKPERKEGEGKAGGLRVINEDQRGALSEDGSPLTPHEQGLKSTRSDADEDHSRNG